MIIELIGIAGLGLLAGWFVNYLADVLPYTRKLSQPVCRNCSMKTSWLRYLSGRPCNNCSGKPVMRFWIVLLAGVVTAVYLWLNPPGKIGFWPAFGILVYFCVVAIIDLEHRLVLHPVSIAGAVIGLAFGIWRHGVIPTIAGGAAGFLAMLALYYGGDLFARWLARRRGQELTEVALGFGDVNLAGIIGLILGFPGVFIGLWLAIFIGGIISLFYILIQVVLRRYQLFTAIPYAPFLLIGAIVLLFRA